MLNRRPLIWGLILGASSHLIEGILVLLSVWTGHHVWMFIGFAVVFIRLISFFCLNLNVITEADARRKGFFALGWLGISVVLLSIEIPLLNNESILSLIDPHSIGLVHALFWLILVFATIVQILIALLQSLIYTWRHRRTAHPSMKI